MSRQQKGKEETGKGQCEYPYVGATGCINYFYFAARALGAKLPVRSPIPLYVAIPLFWLASK